ncbi:MAG: hypothetical protein R3362_13500, partial [Rhodothermales bacterium]|nr:hypothetical protein [Rhodothermales bacterium]
MDSLIPGLRPADLLDVALVAVLLYVIISWFQSVATQGTARRAALLVGALAALYGVALWLDLYLVAQVLGALALA